MKHILKFTAKQIFFVVGSVIMKAFILSLLLFCLCSASNSGRQLKQKRTRGYPQTYASATLFVPPSFNCNGAGRFPFIASIKDRTLSKNHICGGVLIAKDAVLTAAHCVDPRATRNAIVFPQVNLAGDNLESFVEKLNTIAAFPHPDWTGDIRDGNDLVILKLERASCTLPLTVLGARKKITKAGMYQFMGYGRSSDAGAFSSLLQLAPMTFIPKAACERDNGITLRDGELCFTGDDEIGVCSGDDGGPLVVPPEGLFGLYEEVVGIVSYTTGECGDKGAAVFMDIAAYKDWIDDILESEF